MLLTVVLWSHCRLWTRPALIGLTARVGLSRISLGAHLPVDVAAGYACGALSAWVGAKVLALRSSTEPRRAD
jgi:membrane-associated phospholipid phosphatase